MSRDGVATLWQRWRGEALLLARRGRADAELAAAFPELTAAERLAIARRSAWLQARLAGERFATRDAVRLCRDLTLDGSDALQQLRATTGSRAAPFSAPLGAAALAVRAVALYGGDPDRHVTVLPGADGDGAVFPFLGRTVRCATRWIAPEVPLFPVFGYLEAHGRSRVVFSDPITGAGDAEEATASALAAIERAARERPEAWPWGTAATPSSPRQR